MKPGELCETCTYFEDTPLVAVGGQCHRDPPTLAWGMSPDGHPVPAASAFPPTNYKGWCGHWEKGKMVKVEKIIPKNIQPLKLDLN